MRLSKVKHQTKVRVLFLNTEDKNIKRRLCDLGIYAGEKLTVLKTSILKKVMLIEVKNYCLCLKTQIANDIEVEIE